MGWIYCSVTIVFEEILTLDVDQCSNVAQTNNIYGRVLKFQLNYMKKINITNKLCSGLTYLKRRINITKWLYTSPEGIIRNPWFALVPTFISNGVLNLVCVNDFHLFHLFGMFGITFRKDFCLWRSCFSTTLLIICPDIIKLRWT